MDQSTIDLLQYAHVGGFLSAIASVASKALPFVAKALPFLKDNAGSIIQAGSNIVGGILGREGASGAKSANAELSRENRDWQERMSNTAHRREVHDLKAAGLNPILSATGGMGASTPSGSTATMAPARMEDAIGKGLSSAQAAYAYDLQSRTLAGELALKDSTVNAQAAAAATSISSARKIDAETTRTHLDNVRLGHEAGTWKSAADRAKAENALGAHQANIDKKAIIYDNIMNRAEQATGMISDVVRGIKIKVPGTDRKTTEKVQQMENFLKRTPNRRPPME